MSALVVIFHANQGEEGKLEKLLTSMVERARTEDGVVSYTLYKDHQDPGLYVIHEVWDSREALDRHSTTRFTEQTLKAAYALSAPPQVLPGLETVATL